MSEDGHYYSVRRGVKGFFLSRCRWLVPLVLAAEVWTAVSQEVRVSDFGFDAEDSTRFLQAAIDSGAVRVVVDRQASPWVTEPLLCRWNQEIVFENGVEVVAKKGAFRGRNDCLFTLKKVHDIKLTGLGDVVLRMHHDDYMSADYSRSEWRHVICILSSDRITLENLELRDSGGDGLYVADARNGPASRDIVARRVISSGNARQGSSIISVEGLLYEDCVFANTRGRPPQAGIDIEPNSGHNNVCGCIFRRCRFENNAGNGFQMSYPKEAKGRLPGSVRLEACVFRGNNYGFSYGQNRKEPYYVKGEVSVTDCTFEGTRGPAIVISRKIGNSFKATVSNCRIENCCTGSLNGSEIRINSLFGDFEPPSAIALKDIEIIQSTARDWIQFTNMPYGPHDKIDFTGNVLVRSPAGVKRVAIDDAFRANAFPGFWNKGEPPRGKPMKEICTVVDSNPACSVKLTRLGLRGTSRYVFYAAEAGPVIFIGSMKPASAVSPVQMRVVSAANGKEGRVLPMGQDGRLVVETAEPGLQTLTVLGDKEVFTLVESHVPVALEVAERPHALRVSSGDLFFYVPADRPFNVMVCGESWGERVGAALYSPDGTEVWSEPGAIWWHGYRARGRVPEGLWRLNLRHPNKGVLQDYSVDMTGTNPYLFLSSEKYWK